MNDITDAESLDTILSQKYKNLNYKIIVTLICGKCFNPDTIYTSSSDNISIFNIATIDINDGILFETCFCNIFAV